jgi:radical SAM protein with 4Fe4S-binding SPASM domain
MVNHLGTRSFLARAWHSLQRDVDGFVGRFTPTAPPAPGLYTYHLDAAYGQRRLHLRVDTSGSGVLFVDVTDVIHLNATAVHMAALALADVPQARAESMLSRSLRGPEAARLTQELASIYQMIARLRRTDGTECPTCTVAALERAPLFSTPPAAPYKADLALTYGCNNACAHCYNEPDRFDMASLSATGWFRALDTLAHVGVPHIIFTGGEATLHPDLPRLIAYANQKGQIVGLNTNGRRLAHRPFAQQLAEAGLNHVQITLGSSRPDVHNAVMHVDAFEQTVRGIDNALACGLHTITNTTLMRSTADHVGEIIDFLYARGIRTFAMNGMIHAGGGFADPEAIPPDELAPILMQVRDHAARLGMRFLWYTPTEYCRLSPVELELGAKRCNAGEYSLCIEPNGDVLPCQSYYVAAGNLLRDPWEQIWHSDLFHSFRDRTANPQHANLPAACHDCPDLALCGGGCRIERESREGRRVAEAEHGCGGCHPRSAQPEPDAGFIPVASLSKAALRSQGHLDRVPVPAAERTERTRQTG